MQYFKDYREHFGTMLVWAPAGVEHGVQNTGAGLVLLVGVAPGGA